jgi:predicted dinucleotide-binding enzyme
MRVGIIGAGQVGTTLGKGWVKAGHRVVYGVREPGAAPPHEGAEVDSVSGAAPAADVVARTAPWAAMSDALTAAGDLRGKPLLDVTNPIGPGFALALGHTTSGAERVASLARLRSSVRETSAVRSRGPGCARVTASA